MKNGMIGLGLAIAALAGTANAATYSVSGAYNDAGNSGVGLLGIGSTTGINFSQGSGNNFVRGTVNAASVLSSGSGGQNLCFTLVLTDFEFKSDAAQGTTDILVTVSQDFVVSADAQQPGTGSHQVNGIGRFGAAGQSISVGVASTHESTVLAPLSVSLNSVGAGDQVINDGEPSVNVASDLVYTITATYRFSITANGVAASIILPDSGVDNACFVLVPLPPAAYAGMGGLAFAGLAAVRRRRMNRA